MLFKRVRRRVGLIEALIFSLQRVLIAPRAPAEWRGRRFLTRYAEMAGTVIYARSINSREVRTALRAHRCDLLILGQTGIVRSDVLSIPTLGTLNAHPGILPEYRGIDCERWAIYRDELDKVGCTVHWVDAGVDTGDIVVRERYQLRAGETLSSLSESLYSLAARMLADVVAALLEGAPVAATR